MTHAFNPNTQEADLWVSGQPNLHREFQASQCHSVKPALTPKWWGGLQDTWTQRMLTWHINLYFSPFYYVHIFYYCSFVVLFFVLNFQNVYVYQCFIYMYVCVSLVVPSVSGPQTPWGWQVFSPCPLCHDILPYYGPKARVIFRERQKATLSERERNSRINNKERERKADALGWSGRHKIN